MEKEYIDFKLKNRNRHIILILLSLLIPVLFIINIIVGVVNIPLKECLNILLNRESVNPIYYNIVINSRIPQTLTAILAGSGLAVAGLQMQSLFKNPLADPSIIGISSGATLGVAISMILTASFVIHFESFTSINILTTFSALLGAFAILGLITWVSNKTKQTNNLLIIGIMISFICSSIVGILQYTGLQEKVHSYVIWGLGSFSGSTWNNIYIMTPIIIISLCLAWLQSKKQNMMLLGESYAYNLGLNIRQIRIILILCSGTLTAVITAFCGPIAFIGLAVPHIARITFRTSDHNILIPATIIIGSITTLICNLIINMPVTNGIIPVNSITSLVGAPIVIYFLMKGKVKN